MITFVLMCAAIAALILCLLCEVFLTDDTPGGGYGTEKPARCFWRAFLVLLALAVLINFVPYLYQELTLGGAL